MPTRTIIIKSEVAFSRSGYGIVYDPQPRNIIKTVSAQYFESSLYVWGEKAKQILYDKYLTVAKLELEGLGGTSLDLEYFIFDIIDVYEGGMGFSGKEYTSNLDKNKFGEQISYRDGKTILPSNLIPASPESFIRPETSETPEFIYRQLEVIQESMERADSYNDYMLLKNEMNKLKMRYRM